MNEVNTEDERVKLHETATHQFFQMKDGSVWQSEKASGKAAQIHSLDTLLLLDIAQSLCDIRLWGIAQHTDIGQRTYNAG
jgi:hypothetical protein